MHAVPNHDLDAPADAGVPSAASVRTVLVVDDSKMQRKILSAILGRWGYQVVEAGSGDEALALCSDLGPDLILSDWMMPGMSGVEFCEAYRALGLERYGYFILLTSRSEKADVVQGLERGADDFLSKPVHPEELRGRILAGERIIGMQAVVNERNQQLSETLTKLRTVYQAIDRDLEEARRLQQSLVPERHRRLTHGEAALLLRPSGHVGGDLVGMFRVTESRIGLYAIDVAGHGIASALMTARLAGYLTGSSPDQNVALTIDDMGLYSMRPPHEVCAILNRLVCDEQTSQPYFTMILADCDLRRGKVTMAQAGHPNPLILRSDGRMDFVGQGGMPIGLVDSATFEDVEFEIGLGDRLLIHSDGFTECPAPDGTMLEDEGLKRFVAASRNEHGLGFLESLVSQLEEFAGGHDFPDDVSAALLERSAPMSVDP